MVLVISCFAILWRSFDNYLSLFEAVIFCGGEMHNGKGSHSNQIHLKFHLCNYINLLYD